MEEIFCHREKCACSNVHLDGALRFGEDSANRRVIQHPPSWSALGNAWENTKDEEEEEEEEEERVTNGATCPFCAAVPSAATCNFHRVVGGNSSVIEVPRNLSLDDVIGLTSGL